MEKYNEYLKDESRLRGSAENIYFPQTKEEVKEIFIKNKKITLQGSRTGIVGGSLPLGGSLVNFSKMNKINLVSEDIIELESGVMLKDINQYLNNKKSKYFFPINPTEDSASIGGVIASNAKGLSHMKYGFVGKYIEELCIILPSGEEKYIRGEEILDFIGSEGSLGAIISAKLKLIKKSKNIWGIIFFFEENLYSFNFIESLRNTKLDISALEFIDRNSIDLLEEKKSFMSKIKSFPDIPSEYESLVYVEIEKESEEEIEEVVGELLEIAEENNSDGEKAWIFEGYEEVQRMRGFRHTVMESILSTHSNYFGFNLKIRDKSYGEVVEIIKRNLDCEKIYNFGSASDVSVYTVAVNEKDYEDLECKIDKLIEDYCSEEDFISDYGIGKIFGKYMKKYNKEKTLEIIKRKKIYDRDNKMNCGNILGDEV